MFCRNCGTDVTDMKYCPKCGTPTTIENMMTGEKSRDSTVKRKYMPAVIGVGIVFLIIVVIPFLHNPASETMHNSIESKNDIDKLNIKDNSEELPKYSFAVDEYVEIQSGNIDNVKATDYLPDRDMTLTYEDKNGLSVIYYITPVPNETKVEYRTTEELVNFDSYLGGEYTYNEESGCILDNVHGGNTNIYLIPIGKSSSIDDISYQTPPYLFTVETDAGVYEDCICMLYEFSFQSQRKTTATYYAKGIGKILETTNFFSDDINTFEVSERLTDIENGISVLDSDIPQDNSNHVIADTEGNDTLNYEEQRFECFETSGGWDAVISLYFVDGNVEMALEGITSIYLNSTGEDKYEGCTEYDVDSWVYLEMTGNEVILTGTGELEQYSGTYIQLPDLGTDGEN